MGLSWKDLLKLYAWPIGLMIVTGGAAIAASIYNLGIQKGQSIILQAAELSAREAKLKLLLKVTNENG